MSRFASRYNQLKLDLKVVLLFFSAMIVWGFAFPIYNGILGSFSSPA